MAGCGRGEQNPKPGALVGGDARVRGRLFTEQKPNSQDGFPGSAGGVNVTRAVHPPPSSPRRVRMTSSDRLSDIAIQRALGQLPGWSRRGDVLTKPFAFATYLDGIAFVNRVAEAAEAADHHPDLDVRWGKVTCTLSTHSAGGITQKDLDLAGEIERLSGSV